jgi:hypothetical protein
LDNPIEKKNQRKLWCLVKKNQLKRDKKIINSGQTRDSGHDIKINSQKENKKNYEVYSSTNLTLKDKIKKQIN